MYCVCVNVCNLHFFIARNQNMYFWGNNFLIIFFIRFPASDKRINIVKYNRKEKKSESQQKS